MTLFDKMLEIGMRLEKDPNNEKLQKEYKQARLKVVEAQLKKLFDKG